MVKPHLGEEWVSSISQLATAYEKSLSETQQMVYALAEQIHSHYCFSRGPVHHTASRPDEHISIAILGALAGADWWLARSSGIAPVKRIPDDADDTREG